MHPPDLLLSSPLQLSEQLKCRTNQVRSRIVKTNYNTQFAQTASELADFRHATAGVLHGMDNDTLSEFFQKMVQFTPYDAYAPLIARFFGKPCKRSTIVDLFSPGVPDCLLGSSSTTGGSRRWFPRYKGLSMIGASNFGPPPATCIHHKSRTNAFMWCFGILDKIDVEDEDCSMTTPIYLTYVSVQFRRMVLQLGPEKDGEKMATILFDHTAPYATGFISNWRSFILMHALFALGSRSVETVSMSVISTFVEMMCHLDAEFDMMVDCIANGTIPDLNGIADVRHYLELNISPDPERATELRKLGRPSSRPAWCAHVWPNLRSVTAVASGSFGSYVPLARTYLGPDIAIFPLGYACSEVLFGGRYNPLELNQFKLLQDNVFEFLDVSKSDSISDLVQVWEVQLGKRYEFVVTTQDGLWRYRVGDVVEIAGFDPRDGVPIVQFVERRNVEIRVKAAVITEKELMAAMSSALPNILVKLIDWTTAIDDRRFPERIGFFVELVESGNEVPGLAFATERALEKFVKSNATIAQDYEEEMFCKPTIRVVQSGTFSEFRQMKLDEGAKNPGQIKVPTVLPKEAYVTWFSQRVIREL